MITQQELEAQLKQILPLDKESMNQCRKRWDSIAKPLHGLGLLEDMVVNVAGMMKTPQVAICKKVLLIMCADNGIVEEGVTQTGQEVTAIVAENMAKGESCACIMAEQARVDVVAADIGVAADLCPEEERYPLKNVKIAYGTQNFLKEPAMTREQALEAISTGIRMVKDLYEEGYRMIFTGEMGIGNTTTSSAVASVLLRQDPEKMTGKGAGLSPQGLNRKISVIKEGIARRKPNPEDAIDVVSKVGGLDLAGLAGVFLGCALYRIPAVLDGFISSAAALLAVSLAPQSRDYMICSHLSGEDGGRIVLDALGFTPVIQAGMCLGEGTGAVALAPLFDMALSVYLEMSTFHDIQIQEYRPL